MTRIENQPGDDREAFKREVMTEIRHDAFRRKAIGCGACALVWIALLGGGGWYAARLIAKSGLADVPVAGEGAYVAAAPTRVVAPLAGTEAKDIPKLVGARAKFDAQTSQLSVPISEAELTTLVASSLANGGGASLPFPVERAQVVVEPEFVEVFAVVRRDGGETTLRIRFIPAVGSGALAFTTEEVMLGGVVIPNALGDAFFASIRPRLNEAILKAAGEAGGELRAVDLTRGTLSVVFSVKKR